MKFLALVLSLFATEVSASVEVPISVETDILLKINSVRELNGLKPLIIRPSIEKVAQTYSAEMAERIKPYGHANFERRVSDIASDLPFNAKGPSMPAENINWIYNSQDLAESAVNSWLNSPRHLRTILGDYTYTGIGIAKSSLNEYYLTQIFWP